MLRIITAAIIVSLLTPFTAAQNKQSQTAKGAMEESNRQEMNQMLSRKPIATVEDNSVKMATLKQINEDFNQLQKLNNEVASCTNERIDYQCTTRLLSDINSRASRLKSNLQLPFDKAEKDKTVRSDVSNEAELRAQLLKLDGLVQSFAKNPTFQQSNVLEVDSAKKAAGDLLNIVELSRRLTKSATKLGKSGQ